MHLFQNIQDNYLLLQQDFIGFTFNLNGIGRYFFDILITVVIFSICYLLGDKVRRGFFKEQKDYLIFINILLGYIIVGTGIAILGALSLLKSEIIWAYFICVSFVALYPFAFNKISLSLFKTKINAFYKRRKEFAVWGVILFIIISIIRLSTPDIGEDGYHTDLPTLYLSSQTSLHEPKDLFHVTAYPQLPEMIYLIPIFLGEKDAAKFIHFGFYILIIFLLFEISKKKEFSFAKYAPLLFVTTPLAVKYSSFQYTDFFMLFAFLLAVIVIKKGNNKKGIFLSGIIFGAVLAAKVWTLVFIPVILLYIAIINRKIKLQKIILLAFLFLLGSVVSVSFWDIRAFIIGGSPLYPFFANLNYPDGTKTLPMSLISYFNLTWKTFTIPNLLALSPLFFLGIIFLIGNYREAIKKIKNSSLVIFLFIITVIHLVVQVYLARYLLPWYIIAIIIVSSGFIVWEKNKLARISSLSIFFVLFFYYLVTTLFTLPYGFGWADRNAYLTRVLGRDNISYYDFEGKFDRWITKRDLVATYGLASFYYADFPYIDVGYIFGEHKRSFDLFKKHKVTRVLIKGGDFVWFCKKLSLTDCDEKKVKLLATYPSDVKKYNLYELTK